MKEQENTAQQVVEEFKTVEQIEQEKWPHADKVVRLDHPVGGGKINELALRKPMPGDLRGLKLLDVIQMDTAATAQLVPRISLNGFTAQHFYQLDPVDLLEVMTEVATFFTKEQLPTL